MNKVRNNKAWWLVLPVFALVAFSAVVPMMTVVNYSVQDIFDQSNRYFVGADWYRQVLRDPALHDAVVGTIWQIFGRADIGLMGATLAKLGVNYNYASDPFDAWLTVLVMDVWHWTSLVALLCYSGLRAIPDVYYQAARIDRASAWAVFRHIQLPKLKNVLLIAVMLRFMDSFMIYTEPFVLTGGGPGNATTFLSQTLTRMAVGQFDLGPAAAFSLVYFLIILLVSWLFYTAMTHADKD